MVDTPGLADTDNPAEETALELAKVLDLCPEGIHVFLYVQDATSHRFTEEQRQVIKQLRVWYSLQGTMLGLHI